MKRLLTIAFVELDEFARLQRQLNAAELLDTLKRYEELVRPVLDRYHGSIAKTLGGSLMVTFESAREAVVAGVLIQERLDAHNRDHEVPLRSRYVAHTGEVEILELDNSYDVFGAPVDIASRMQALSSPGDVLFTHSTREAMDASNLPIEDAGDFAATKKRRLALHRVARTRESYASLLESLEDIDEHTSAAEYGTLARGFLAARESDLAARRPMGPWIVAAALILIAGQVLILGGREVAFRRSVNEACAQIDAEPRAAFVALDELRKRRPSSPRIQAGLHDAVERQVKMLEDRGDHAGVLEYLEQMRAEHDYVPGLEEITKATRLRIALASDDMASSVWRLQTDYPNDEDLQLTLIEVAGSTGSHAAVEAAYKLAQARAAEHPAFRSDERYLRIVTRALVGADAVRGTNAAWATEVIDDDLFESIAPYLERAMYHPTYWDEQGRHEVEVLFERHGRELDPVRKRLPALLITGSSKPARDDTARYLVQRMDEDREALEAAMPTELPSIRRLVDSWAYESPEAMRVLIELIAPRKRNEIEELVSNGGYRTRELAWSIVQKYGWETEDLRRQYERAK